jgi:tetratricopeptide (TPR) repeat protein
MRLSACLFAALLLTSATGWAARPSERSSASWVKEGERHYQAGRYREAAEALQKALQLDPHPRLVYNIARAYDQAGELALALQYYQQYVSSTEGTDPTLLKRSALSIDRLRGLLRQQEDLRAAQEAERRRLAEEAQRAQERADAESEAKRRAEAESETRRRAAVEAELKDYERTRLGAFVAGGGALLGAGVGLTFGLMANGSRTGFTSAPTVAEKLRLQTQARNQALIADVGFGVGLAAAVTAVLLYPKSGPAPQARILVAPNGAGVEVKF